MAIQEVISWGKEMLRKKYSTAGIGGRKPNAAWKVRNGDEEWN